MRVPRVRFTVRSVMLLVLVVGLSLGLDGLRRRRNRWADMSVRHESSERAYLHRAELHRETATQNQSSAESLRAAAAAMHGDGTPNEKLRMEIASGISAAAESEREGERKCRVLARYHRELYLKYAHAARYPWLIVGPDPPEPQ